MIQLCMNRFLRLGPLIPREEEIVDAIVAIARLFWSQSLIGNNAGVIQ